MVIGRWYHGPQKHAVTILWNTLPGVARPWLEGI